MRSELRAACIHEYAHLAVARRFGGCGFVNVASVRGADARHVGWHARFQLHGELADDEWRIVALAGTLAESIDARATHDVRSLQEQLRRPGVLSPADAALCSGYDNDDVARCLALVTAAWRDIVCDACERAARVEASHPDMFGS